MSYEVNLCVILNDYPVYDVHPSNILTDIRQNLWTMEYALGHIYFMRPILMSHWSITPNITFLYQTVFKILSKITGPWNIGHWLTYIYEVNLCIKLIHYPKYDLHPSNSFQDIRQNRWTMKYRSLTYIYFMRSIIVSHWSIIPSVTFIHQTVFKILGKVIQPWNIGHSDLHLMTQKAGSYGWLISDTMSYRGI